MKCLKKTKRTFFNLLEIFSCSACKEYVRYEYIYIGNNTINLYFINKECINDEMIFQFIKLFIKDAIINKEDIYLILSKHEYIANFDEFPAFIDKNNVFILIY